MHTNNNRILLTRITHILQVPRQGLRVQKMITPRRKTNPLPIRLQLLQPFSHLLPTLRNRSRHPQKPFVVHEPSGFDAAVPSSKWADLCWIMMVYFWGRFLVWICLSWREKSWRGRGKEGQNEGKKTGITTHGSVNFIRNRMRSILEHPEIRSQFAN
jgi:hypothetical protein